MWDLKHVSGAEIRPVASDAHLSLSTFSRCVGSRMERLRSVEAPEARAFVDREMAPVLGELKTFVAGSARVVDIDPS